MKKITLSTILLIATILSSFAVVGAIIYVYDPSYTTGTANPATVHITGTFTISPNPWINGQQITLTDELNNHQSGITVFFYEGNESNWAKIGQSITNTQGIATFTFLPVGEGIHNYKAQPQ